MFCRALWNDCGIPARVGILGDISAHFPVWSIGSCHNTKRADPDLPGRNMQHDHQRRSMQIIMSRQGCFGFDFNSKTRAFQPPIFQKHRTISRNRHTPHFKPSFSE